MNFGKNEEAEKAFHATKWCDCGYNSPEEMLREMDINDPRRIRIEKKLLANLNFRAAREKLIQERSSSCSSETLKGNQ